MAQAPDHRPQRTTDLINIQSAVIKTVESTYQTMQWKESSVQKIQADSRAALTIDMIADIKRRKRKKRHERERKERRRLEQEAREREKAWPNGDCSIKGSTPSRSVFRQLRSPSMSHEGYCGRGRSPGLWRRHLRDHYSPSDLDHDRSIHDHYSPSPDGRYLTESSRIFSSDTQTSQTSMISQPTGVQAIFATTPPDHCQTCQVNIAEIERTTSFKFPTMCPICHQPRSLLPLSLHQHATACVVEQQKTPAPEASDKKSASLLAIPHSPLPHISPVKNPLSLTQSKTHDKTTPSARGVRPTQRYRPVYSAPARRSVYRSLPDVSKQWVHDRFEKDAEKDSKHRGQKWEDLSVGMRTDTINDRKKQEVQQHDSMIRLKVKRTMSERRAESMVKLET